MKNLGLLIWAIVLITSCNQNTGKTGEMKTATAAAYADTIKDGVFIHITDGYNDPHRVLMPLKMAVLMAKDKDVMVYMDIHAV